MKTPITLLAIVSLLLSPLALSAAPKEQPHDLARLWSFVPKNGSEGAFLKAFTAHAKWRQDNKDPWTWNIFVTVDGPGIGTYHARSGEHTWGDFDTYDTIPFAAKAQAHWNANVAPLVASVDSVMTRWHADSSHWAENGPNYPLYQIQMSAIKPGMEWQYHEAIKSISKALIDAEWPYDWGVDSVVSGGAVPSFTLVLPAKSWADFAEPDPNFWEVLVDSVGEEKAIELTGKMNAATKHTHVETVRHLPELMVKGAK